MLWHGSGKARTVLIGGASNRARLMFEGRDPFLFCLGHVAHVKNVNVSVRSAHNEAVTTERKGEDLAGLWSVRNAR
jgi:hypothetical protein